QILARIEMTDLDSLRDVDTGAWLAGVHSPKVRELVSAYLRLSTYCDDPRQSAGDAIAQLRRGRSGVIYQDGGWQTLIDELSDVARTGLSGARRVGRRGCSGGDRLSRRRAQRASAAAGALRPRSRPTDLLLGPLGRRRPRSPGGRRRPRGSLSLGGAPGELRGS